MTSRYADLGRPPLDGAALRRALVVPGSRWREIVVVESVASTNAVVAALARDSAAEGLVVTAEHQTGGRGRLGRSWQAPPRSGLALSVLLRPSGVPPARWPWLPLLAGVAVTEAVRRSCDVDAVLKWPNDVLVAGQKMAGILAERVDHAGTAAAVVGIGMNVTLRRDELPVSTATSLALAGASTTDRTVVLRAVLRMLDQLYAAWLADGGNPATGLADAYHRRCSTLGRLVRVELPSGQVTTGTADRIDDDGRLVVTTDADPAGEVTVGAGDVVHLRQD